MKTFVATNGRNQLRIECASGTHKKEKQHLFHRDNYSAINGTSKIGKWLRIHRHFGFHQIFDLVGHFTARHFFDHLLHFGELLH